MKRKLIRLFCTIMVVLLVTVGAMPGTAHARTREQLAYKARVTATEYWHNKPCGGAHINSWFAYFDRRTEPYFLDQQPNSGEPEREECYMRRGTIALIATGLLCVLAACGATQSSSHQSLVRASQTTPLTEDTQYAIRVCHSPSKASSKAKV